MQNMIGLLRLATNPAALLDHPSTANVLTWCAPASNRAGCSPRLLD